MSRKPTMRFSASGGSMLAMPPQAWDQEFEVILGVASGKAPGAFDLQGDYAVVHLRGPLHQHEHWCQDSYHALRERMAAAFASDAPKVLLSIDSPGGDFAGSIELAREIREMKAAAKKPLVAFTDSEALSAAYALATAADEIVLTESSAVGSVGVWAPLADQSVLDQTMGLRFVFVASGEAKVDRNPHVPISDGAIDRLQVQVDQMAGLFFDLVSEHRPLNRARLAALKGESLLGSRALAVGLADRIATWSQLMAGGGGAAKGDTAMSKVDEAYGLLKQAADSDDEDEKKKARKALKAWEDKDEDKDKDKDKESSKAKAGDDEDKDKKKESSKAKAADGDDDKDKKKDDEKKGKAQAADEDKDKDKGRAAANAGGPPTLVELAQELHAMRAERAQEKDAVERSALFAQRPDFTGPIKKSLEAAPLDDLRAAVKTWPRIGTAPLAPAMAASARPSLVGKGQGDASQLPELDDRDTAFIDRQMGLKSEAAPTFSNERTLQLGFMTPEQASKRLTELQKGGV